MRVSSQLVEAQPLVLFITVPHLFIILLARLLNALSFSTKTILLNNPC